MKVQKVESLISCFLLLFLAASLLLTPQMACAQTKLIAPEFTAKYVDLSYTNPPVYGTDQYTGKTIVTRESYLIDNRSIQFTIKNQPFTPQTMPNGSLSNLFFNFRMKGTYGTEWDYTPFAPDGQSTSVYGGVFLAMGRVGPAPAYYQSDGNYTTVTVTIPGAWRVPQGATLDMQVQAIAGYMHYGDKQYHFEGEFGPWGNTQTVVVTTPPSPNDPVIPSNESPPLASDNPTATFTPTVEPTPTVTALEVSNQMNTDGRFDWQTLAIAMLLVVVVALTVVVVFQYRNAIKKKDAQKS